MSPTKYYHVTPTKNLPSILKNGLIPQVGPRSMKLDEPLSIFLFSSKENAIDGVVNWLAEEFAEDEELSMLEIHLPSRINVHDIVGWEVCVEEVIPLPAFA